MNVAELIKILSTFSPSALVEGTYEGITREIDDVYQLPGGRVLIDVDGGFYKNRFLEG